MKYVFFLIIGLLLLVNTLKKNPREVSALDFYDSSWVKDTIDFPQARLILSVPLSSIRHSREQYIKGHGKSVYYPLKYSLNDEGNWETQILYVEFISTTSYDRLINNDSVDEELWNSFNSGYGGSRSYICNGSYTRIDILKCGIVLFYENLEPQVADIANRIIKSMIISTDKHTPIFNKRKQVPST